MHEKLSQEKNWVLENWKEGKQLPRGLEKEMQLKPLIV